MFNLVAKVQSICQKSKVKAPVFCSGCAVTQYFPGLRQIISGHDIMCGFRVNPLATYTGVQNL